MSAYLEQTCLELLAKIGVAAHNKVSADLAARYSTAERHYHTLDHIAHTLSVAANLGGVYQLPQPDLNVVQLAIWFHDAIYDTKASDNEEKSAEYAGIVLSSWQVERETIEQVQKLILATKSHHLPDNNLTSKILLDADLAILAESNHKYTEYSLAIRREYNWVSEATYRVKRKAVLHKFLQRERLYFTDWMFERYEDVARQNLRREIETLSNSF